MPKLSDTIRENVTGNVERAVIEIMDEREVVAKKIEGGKASTKRSAFGITATNITDAAKSKLGGSIAAEDVKRHSAMSLTPAKGYKQFFVQFNPANLQISGQGGGNAQITNVTKTGGAVSMGDMKTRIQLMVPLIFDKVYIKDAFMADKFQLNPTSAVSGGIAAIANKEYSVQPIVEGFIAALRNPRTRKITFAWSKMSYSGVMNSVSAQYTMFSVSGKPIRAVVNLGILCADQATCKGYMGQWQSHYEDAFLKDFTSDYEKTAQKVQNIVNLPF